VIETILSIKKIIINILKKISKKQYETNNLLEIQAQKLFY